MKMNETVRTMSFVGPEGIYFEPELNFDHEYNKLKDKMVNALGNIDPRMPKEYLTRALNDAVNKYKMYQEYSFPE